MSEENQVQNEETLAAEGGELGNAAEQPPEAPSPAPAAVAAAAPARKVPAKLLKYIDDKLKSNGLAQHAIEQKDARTVMRLAAEALVGIREQGGNNRGPLVELIQDVIGKHGEYWAWCMSFVQVCIAYAEEKTGVMSPIVAHEHCLTVWNQTDKKLRCTADPMPGAIIIWRHGDSASGHTGILTGYSGDASVMTAIEGNTESGVDPSGKVERDGGGVYATKRSTKGVHAMRVMGFLKPF